VKGNIDRKGKTSSSEDRVEKMDDLDVVSGKQEGKKPVNKSSSVSNGFSS
jgi:hypothetical protein